MRRTEDVGLEAVGHEQQRPKAGAGRDDRNQTRNQLGVAL
jgi:hypothetical protein